MQYTDVLDAIDFAITQNHVISLTYTMMNRHMRQYTVIFLIGGGEVDTLIISGSYEMLYKNNYNYLVDNELRLNTMFKHWIPCSKYPMRA